MDKGQLYTHMQWRQEDPAPNAEPGVVDLAIPQTIIADIYYSACVELISTIGAANKVLT